MNSKNKACQEMKGFMARAKDILQETLDTFEKEHTLANSNYIRPFAFYIEQIRDILAVYLFAIFKFEGQDFKVDQRGFVNFQDIALDLLNTQSQYASRYVDGRIDGYPNLGKGLRFAGDPADYHELKIHKDDLAEFVIRVRDYKSQYR